MPQNDDQLAKQYQEILNKYASSITPSTIVDTPKPESIKPPITPESIPETTFENPKPVVSTPVTPPIYFPSEPVTEKPSNFFKYLFYFSFLLFITVVSIIVYNFVNKQQTPALVTNVVPTNVPTKSITQFCELNDKQISVGESFPSEDSCNTCSCTSNLTIVCTQEACVSPTVGKTSPTAVPTKKVSVKTYKDIKYGYQFECPTTAKYVLEATSINGNKIPFKQESCTLAESPAIISVYDNTLVHDFNNIQTQISPDKKYIFTFEGDNDEVISSFKFL